MSDCEPEECSNCGNTGCTCNDDVYQITKVRQTKIQTDCPEDPTLDCPLKEATFDDNVQDFIIPAVGSTGQLLVCNPEVYTVGQWIVFSNGNTFQITAIGVDYLTVRNSCVDGITAIESNDAPGVTIPSGTKFWVGSEPECSIVSEEGETCFQEATAVDEAEQYHMFAGTTTDVGGGVFASCIRKILKLIAFNNTLCFESFPEFDGIKTSGISTKLVVKQHGAGGDPEGCLGELAHGNDGLHKYCDGDIKFVTNGRVPVIVTRTKIHDAIYGAGDRTINISLPDFPEDCGSGVCASINVQAWSVTEVSDDLHAYQIYINNQEVCILAGNEQAFASDVPFPGTANGHTVVCGLSTNSVELKLENLTTDPAGRLAPGNFNPADNESIRVWVWLEMYYV